MKPIIIILIIIMLGSYHLFSQKDTSQFYNKKLSNNNFSIELGGKALLYSVGYERIVYRSSKILFTGNLNLSYEPFAGFHGIMAPIGINIVIGEKQNKLQLGVFMTNSFDFNPNPKTSKEREAFRVNEEYKYDKNYYPPYRLYFIVPSIGYRRYFKKGNSVSFEYTYLIYNFYGELFFAEHGLVPWFGINYNLNF